MRVSGIRQFDSAQMIIIPFDGSQRKYRDCKVKYILQWKAYFTCSVSPTRRSLTQSDSSHRNTIHHRKEIFLLPGTLLLLHSFMII